ncbi:hypothetical protein NDU88_000298 [Pleurodeles waltl]|uniref:Uncharacterized protein n=1 Tax=Pleurodeles waltl TaxID=8319 RepID=A0AAV7WF47_PLEWA|nr:hypothetical protein NDU88_000298 [Pleurodeles waltl]
MAQPRAPWGSRGNRDCPGGHESQLHSLLNVPSTRPGVFVPISGGNEFYNLSSGCQPVARAPLRNFINISGQERACQLSTGGRGGTEIHRAQSEECRESTDTRANQKDLGVEARRRAERHSGDLGKEKE